MSRNDSLGDRMKGYENVTRVHLTRRTPVIIRIDGKAFHTWTKQLKHVDNELEQDPFSGIMNAAMAETTRQLVTNIQNAVLGYTQSDEISILLNDWKTLETDAWFSANIQKMVSVAASMATVYFNNSIPDMLHTYRNLSGKQLSSAMFDARVFNLPKEEVANYFIWRQQDASRNSVQMLARHYFSHRELHRKNNSEIQDMLMGTFGINWNDIDTWKKRGCCALRDPFCLNGVVIDREIPIFTQDRNYIEKHLLEEKE